MVKIELPEGVARDVKLTLMEKRDAVMSDITRYHTINRRRKLTDLENEDLTFLGSYLESLAFAIGNIEVEV